MLQASRKALGNGSGEPAYTRLNKDVRRTTMIGNPYLLRDFAAEKLLLDEPSYKVRSTPHKDAAPGPGQQRIRERRAAKIAEMKARLPSGEVFHPIRKRRVSRA